MKNKLILLGLNELNFDFIRHYIDLGYLKNFKRIFEEYGYSETTSEDEYKLLEPWIQWVTIHTGKKYSDHEVFRLGDIVNRKDLKQIFEIAEEKGYSVGAVSPFNADNRLKNPKFFVPDPWTQTSPSGEKFVKEVSKAVSQAVNDNAQEKVSKNSILAIFKAFLRAVPFSSYGQYVKLAASIKSKVGIKAVVLDKLLGDIFVHQWKKHSPDFSNLFLNTGAHFQHHYMFNSSAYDGEFKNPKWYCPEDQDPLFMILDEYDKIIGRLLELETRLIICTGLHQKPHKHNTFYWRLKNHQPFLENELGIKGIQKLTPRMSRDFLIEFGSESDASVAQNILEKYVSEKDGAKIFTVDNRKESLFVELTYPNDIDDHFSIIGDNKISNFRKNIAFVAIKNGEHHTIGYYIDTANKVKTAEQNIPLSQVFDNMVAAL
ncbi:hypothetical protein GCM10009430_07350 [Aquimarina litoralis]|uniref:Type I phosphodiesterase / nucleotide pyrophosphatase n=1 Tax=Aquimarina litoralis TaxID=584605 RepID=A0ABP3TR95_9FLAO